MHPMAALLGFEDSVYLRVAGRPVQLIFGAPPFARESAASLPGALQWKEIHCRVTAWLLQKEARVTVENRSRSVFQFD